MVLHRSTFHSRRLSSLKDLEQSAWMILRPLLVRRSQVVFNRSACVLWCVRVSCWRVTHHLAQLRKFTVAGVPLWLPLTTPWSTGRRTQKDGSPRTIALRGRAFGRKSSACLLQDAALQEQEEQNRHAERLNDTLFVLDYRHDALCTRAIPGRLQP